MIAKRFVLVTSLFLVLTIAYAEPEQAPMPKGAGQPTPMGPRPTRPGFTPKAAKPDGMALSGLSPAKIFPDLCKYQYRVSTSSEECQKYCDQAHGFYYSYVWIEAVRSFETALKHDPDCAYAWLGLYRAMEKYGAGNRQPQPNAFLALTGGATQPKMPDRFTKTAKDYALDMAKALMTKANHREQLIITAKLQEKGMWPNVTPEERKKKAIASLDELLTLYPDDEEAWFARAQISEGPNSTVPFYKALLLVNPINPGANHELVHHYENIRRPALGWVHAEKYMESSPGIPHAYHMQAHLATRIGKWQFTSDWSSRAIDMQKKYHAFQGVTPGEDHQFQHHMEILTRSLVHDGRYKEATKIKTEALGYNYKFNQEWFRMAVTTKDWTEANKIIDAMRKTDKSGGSYYAAIVALEQGDTKKAQAELDVLREGGKKLTGRNEYRTWEIQGRLMCQMGQGESGCKLFRRIIEKTKDDFQHHSWGGGAYYMEQWGIAALEGGVAAEAEEAFQEALAHDAGSVRGALGMWALCEQLGRTEESERYMKVARKCWAKADPKDFENIMNSMAKKAKNVETTASSITDGNGSTGSSK